MTARCPKEGNSKYPGGDVGPSNVYQQESGEDVQDCVLRMVAQAAGNH